MRHIILKGYAVGAIVIPPDAGGGRIIQIGAHDGSELIEIAVDDQTWDDFTAMGERLHVAASGDVEKFTPHMFVAGRVPGLCARCELPADALAHRGAA